MSDRNNLFPVFLKLEELDTLIVGGGNVALEKIGAIQRSSPGARITVVSPAITSEIIELSSRNKKVRLQQRPFRVRDLSQKDIVILATDDPDLHRRIKVHAKKRRLLVNVADTPALCDFYLGSVVTKGNLKIGISTNGKSPTIAKRMREFFEEMIPDEVEQLFDNMQQIRNKIKGDFQEKIRILNEVTSAWLRKNE